MGLSVTVVVEVGDESAITRCVENHDERSAPQPSTPGGDGWRDVYYSLTTPEDVIDHLASACVRLGIEDASRLDGWADLRPGAVTMLVEDVDRDWLTTSSPGASS
jgi:hypothetical protein